MTRNMTRTSRKASTASKPVNVPAQASAAEDSRADIYQRITDRIAAAIEAGAGIRCSALLRCSIFTVVHGSHFEERRYHM